MGMSIFTQAFYRGNCALTVIVTNEFAEIFHSANEFFAETDETVQWQQYTVCFNGSHKQILHMLSNECVTHTVFSMPT